MRGWTTLPTSVGAPPPPEQLSRTLAQLDEMGVVEFVPSDGDKRRRPVRLTLRGRAIAKALRVAPVADDMALGIALAAEYHAALLAGGRVFRDDFSRWAQEKVSAEVATATWDLITDEAKARHVVIVQGDAAFTVPDGSEAALSDDSSADWIAAWAEVQHRERGVEVVFVRNDSQRDDWMRAIQHANAVNDGVELRLVNTVDMKLGSELPNQDRPYDILYTHPFIREREPSHVGSVVKSADRTWVLSEDERSVTASAYPLFVAEERARFGSVQP